MSAFVVRSYCIQLQPLKLHWKCQNTVCQRTNYYFNYLHRSPKPRSYANDANNASSQKKSSNFLISYLQSLKWVPIPLGVGFAYLCYQQFWHTKQREEKKLQGCHDPNDVLATDWLVTIYKCFPLKIMSRAWGRVNDYDLPVWLRSPVIKSYIWATDCNLEEAADTNLENYKNLGQFFCRRLHPKARKIDYIHCLTSPSDGRILYCGRVHMGQMEQVKGVTYSLCGFLGPDTWDEGEKQVNNDTVSQSSPGSRYDAKLKVHPDNELYHCIIYLAPGDYHRFHAPTEWHVTHRRYFPGELFSVNPSVVRLIKGLFNYNERAVYIGRWLHGFFALGAVGATNVGSIHVYHDKELHTNMPKKFPEGCHLDVAFTEEDECGFVMKRGDDFGEFRLGSTIVLVFEAPKDFQFCVAPGETKKKKVPTATLR